MKLGLFLLPAFFTDASDVKQPSRTDFAIFLPLIQNRLHNNDNFSYKAILRIHPI